MIDMTRISDIKAVFLFDAQLILLVFHVHIHKYVAVGDDNYNGDVATMI